MKYEISFTRKAFKSLRKIGEPNLTRIKKAIYDLMQNPRPAGCKKLKGRKNSYRIRSGEYRIIYDIQDDVLVIGIIAVGHRKDIYNL